MRRSIVLMVGLALVASGCTGAGHSGQATPTAAGVTSTSGPAAATTTAPAAVPVGAQVTASAPAASPTTPLAVTLTPATLGAAGIATVADETSTTATAAVTGTKVLTVTAWQATNLGEEAAAHGGIIGADLNTMLPMPANAPQLDDILGGWVIAHPDPDSVEAAGLLGTPDWTHPDQVVFPTAVLLLFVADILQRTATTAPAASSSAPGSAGVTPGGASATTKGAAWSGTMTVRAASLVTAPCSTVSNFVDSVLDYVFGLLKVNPADVQSWVSGALGGGTVANIVGAAAGFLSSIWNSAVDLAEQTAKNILKQLSQPILNAMALVIGGAAVFSMIRSYLKPWVMTVTPDPVRNRFAVDPAPALPGTFSLSIDKSAEISDWPPQFVDCASAADIKLPTLANEGSPATWTVTPEEPGLVTPGQLAGKLDANLKTTLDYTTNTEDAKTASTGQEVDPTVLATVKVRRAEVEELRQLVTGYLTGKVPAIVAPVVNPILTAYLEQATKYLDDLTAVTGSSTIVVSHHVPKPTPTPPTGCAAAIPAGTYTGPISGTIISTLHFSGQVSADGKGTQQFTGKVSLVSNGTTVTGSIEVSGSGTSHVGLDSLPIGDDSNIGGMKGTISGPASSPTVAGTLASDDQVAGHVSEPFKAGLHLTSITCTSVSGDLLAMMKEVELPVAQYVTLTGNASWTATKG